MKKIFLTILSSTFLRTAIDFHATTTLRDQLGTLDDSITSITQHPTFKAFCQKYNRVREGYQRLILRRLQKFVKKYEKLSYPNQIKSHYKPEPLYDRCNQYTKRTFAYKR